jgi:exodeoxyribonuclease V gamma subunit
MTTPLITPGFLALHSHRSEWLAETLSAWLTRQPLAPLEQEVVLVQSNGMAEWIKMTLASQGVPGGGVCAATRVELPSRFLWRTYRQVLGAQNVPPDSPLDKLPMTWRLMALLPACVGDAVFQPVAGFLRGPLAEPEPDRLLQLASRLADLFDQYQIYRPDWLQDWAEGRDVLRQLPDQAVRLGDAARQLPEDQLWQAELWRRVLATLSDAEQQATRPALHLRALTRLQSGQALASPVARRVSVFGMSHMPGQLLEMLAALSAHSQVLLAVPNPCQYHWGDIMDGRDALRAERRRHAYKKDNLSTTPFEQMHLHAPALLAAWGRQGRDFIRQLDAFDDLQAAQERMPGQRLDLFDDAPGADGSRLLIQLQNRIRDLRSAQDPVDAPLSPDDDSVVFKVAHSPVRELEVLHDQLLTWFHAQPEVSPRDVVVMVPDIELMAPAIRAVFGQYKRGDARFIPFDIADLGAQATSPLIHAVEWLLALPQQRALMSELVALLEVPALAARFGLVPEQLPTLTRWMAGSGIRWGLSAPHRAGLGLAACGDDNSALFGVQRMLMGYACGADPVPDAIGSHPDALGIDPYAEVGGLDAELAGALAHLLQALMDWWQQCVSAATPQQWAERCRAMLAALFKSQNDQDRNALSALEQALSDWTRAADQADFAQVVPLAVARSAWLEALKVPKLEQRFRAGGVTFCTLMPMRAIPFQMVCLLGMNDGDYPRRSPRADFDLLGLPGMGRPGDRSRRDDDRQLMLEALLSARRTLYVSWSGRSVRNNSEQPPSVLVSQLRDEIDALWGAGSAERLTTVYPLQPFSRAYFEEGSKLHTYAKEWRAAQAEARSSVLAQADMDRFVPRDDGKREPDDGKRAGDKGCGDDGMGGDGQTSVMASEARPSVREQAEMDRFVARDDGKREGDDGEREADDGKREGGDGTRAGDKGRGDDGMGGDGQTSVMASEARPSMLGLLPPLESAQGQPVIKLAQLARFLRQPVGAFFRERLQVHLEDERNEWHDEELFGLGGLDLYQLLNHQIQHVPTDLSPETLPAHARRVVRRLRLAGALPLAGVGQLKAGELIAQLEAMLGAALREREGFSLPAPRVLIDVAHPHVQLQDALSGVLTAPQAGEGDALLLSLRANALADLKSKTPKAMPDKLIDIWLVSLVAAAMGQPLHCVVVGANAVLRVPPPEPDAARAQLQVLLDTWAEGMRWPLPLPPALALQWLKDRHNLNALHDLYEGSSHQRAERSKDPALARTYPTLNDLMASADFERLAEAVYAPLRDWAALIQVEALPDAPAEPELEGQP